MRSIHLIAALTLLQLLAFLLALPSWIPGWDLAPWLIGGVAYVLILWLLFLLLKRLRNKFRESLSARTATLSLLFTGLAFFGWIAATGLVTGILASGGLFPQIYLQEYDFPEEGVTLYLYDNSFLDPSVQLFARRSRWPFMRQVDSHFAYSADIPEASREGDWVYIEPFRYNLKTGEHGRHHP